MSKRVTTHMTEAMQLDRYIENVGHEPPGPWNTPDWLYSNGTLPPGTGKIWFAGLTGGAKRVKLAAKRKASLSPLELVAKARQDRERAQKAYQEAVRGAVTAGEATSKVARAAGISRQRVYQIAS